jgi:hypothetical protein
MKKNKSMARTECGDEQEQRGSGQGCSAVSEKAVWHNAAPGRRAALSSRAHKASPVRPFEEFNKAISDDGWITQPLALAGGSHRVLPVGPVWPPACLRPTRTSPHSICYFDPVRCAVLTWGTNETRPRPFRLEPPASSVLQPAALFR